ncbi:mutator type transposase, partial [Tanacetum coccineum]
WVRHSNCGQQQDHEPIPGELDVIGNDYLYSGTNSKDDGIEKIRRNKLKEIKKANESADNIVFKHFFMLVKVKERVRLHSIETTRKLFLAKNDKLRIRVKCLGKIPVFTLDGEGPSNTKEVAPKKKTTKVKGKKDVGPSDPVRPNKKGKYELGVSRMKAFKAKSAALNQVKGDYSQQYTMLRDYCLELRRANHDTTIKIEVERDSDTDLQTRVFKRIYICLGPLKKGFKACGRDLLGLDGAFMKVPYPGQLLTTVGLDGNNGIYPLAYAIVEKETTCSWTWFSECLGDDLGMTRESNFTFISDRQKGITITMTNVSPCTEHRKWELTSIPCAHVIATNYNMALNGIQVGIPEEWVHKCYWLTTWKHAYTYTLGCLNRKVMWKKSQIPTTLTPPKHHTPVGRPRKIRRKTKEENTQMVKDGKMSRAYKTVTCTKFGNHGHNSRSCKGQKDPMNETDTSTSQRSTNVAADTRKRPFDAGNTPANKKQSTTSSNAGFAIGERHLPIESIIASRSTDVMMAATQTTNNNSIRSILEKEKLNGSNFLDWYRNLRIVLPFYLYEKAIIGTLEFSNPNQTQSILTREIVLSCKKSNA